MKRAIGLAALAGLLLSSTALAQQPEKKRLAVGEPRTDWAQSNSCRGWAPNFGSTVAAALSAKVGETGAFRMLSRSQIATILKEHSMSMNGMADPNTAKAVGRFLQADYLMGLEFLCMPDFLQINVKLVDTETAEEVWQKAYEMRDQNKLQVMTKDVAKMMKEFARTGAAPGAAGTGELFQRINAKRFHASCEGLATALKRSVPRVTGKIEEVNVYGETIKVKIAYATDTYPGLKLKVKRGDEELGTVFLKKKGKGSVEAGTTDDMSAFEEGDQVTTEGWEPSIAIGAIEDEEMTDSDFSEKFAERLVEILGQIDGLKIADDAATKKILQRMGPKADKNSLAKLQKAGVDFLLVGRFYGAGGQRRLDFDVLNTFDGKRVLEKFLFETGI
jgi:TolB-like protein